MTTDTLTTDENGFTVEREYDDLIDWCNHETDVIGENIHVVPDVESRRLDLYRSIGEAGDGRRVKTTIDGVNILNRSDREMPNHWYLTYSEALTLISFLNLFAKERSPAHFTVEYYDDNGKQLTEGERLTEESIYFKYRTESGREREAHINSIYANAIQMMGKW